MHNTRYTCHVKLPGFGLEGQRALQQSRVLVVGMGGLGCPAALYLAAAGVGTLGIADMDAVGLSNLHRQVLYSEGDIGQQKVAIAQQKLQHQNPGISIVAHDIKVTSDNILQLIKDYDLVLDATDNFETRYLLNDACVLAGKPLVYGSIYQYEGQVAVWNMPNEDGTRTPNYRDVFPTVNELNIPDCNEGGVLPAIAGIIGCMQAAEAIKVLTMPADALKSKLLLFDALTMQSWVIKLPPCTETVINRLTASVSIPLISQIQLKQMLADDAITLIDVRTTEEHKAHNIGGINIPMQQMQETHTTLPKNKPIVLYCATGHRSLKTAKWLKKQWPHANICSLENGISNW